MPQLKLIVELINALRSRKVARNIESNFGAKALMILPALVPDRLHQ